MRFYYNPEVAKERLMQQCILHFAYTFSTPTIRDIFSYTSVCSEENIISDCTKEVLVKDESGTYFTIDINLDILTEAKYIIFKNNNINKLLLLLNKPLKFELEHVAYARLDDLRTEIIKKLINILTNFDNDIITLSSTEFDPIYIVELYDDNNRIISNRYRISSSMELLKYLSSKRYTIKSIRKEKKNNNNQKCYRVLK